MIVENKYKAHPSTYKDKVDLQQSANLCGALTVAWNVDLTEVSPSFTGAQRVRVGLRNPRLGWVCPGCGVVEVHGESTTPSGGSEVDISGHALGAECYKVPSDPPLLDESIVQRRYYSLRIDLRAWAAVDVLLDVCEAEFFGVRVGCSDQCKNAFLPDYTRLELKLGSCSYLFDRVGSLPLSKPQYGNSVTRIWQALPHWKHGGSETVTLTWSKKQPKTPLQPTQVSTGAGAVWIAPAGAEPDGTEKWACLGETESSEFEIWPDAGSEPAFKAVAAKLPPLVQFEKLIDQLDDGPTMADIEEQYKIFTEKMKNFSQSHGNEDYRAMFARLKKLFPHLDSRDKMTSCPTFKPACTDVRGTLFDMVIHLNDTHRWTREKIADWLETEAEQLGVDISFPTPDNVSGGDRPEL